MKPLEYWILDIRQQKTVIPERLETNEVSPAIVPGCGAGWEIQSEDVGQGVLGRDAVQRVGS